MSNPYEFYATPDAFTNYLLWDLDSRGMPVHGVIASPCHGAGDIKRSHDVFETERRGIPHESLWLTNDIDPRWPADHHLDATESRLWNLEWKGPIDWVVENPPFTPALDILEFAIENARVGVAMHLRASIHEVLKHGRRRTWMRENRPTGCLWLPRFGYQRSPKTGKWSSDNVCACWLIWVKNKSVPQFFDYAPPWVLGALQEETPRYRARMDQLMLELAETA